MNKQCVDVGVMLSADRGKDLLLLDENKVI